ncbi:Fur-regulated basic protein FbpA [Sutcliffiella cohnii]|uniref:Fur-regulated basic protein FbpA n=1 Tax=Sutcliffiella cohnii TaxID=33932 RepID=UPI0008338B28|nr:Fur-regulated basic protein FbpA [Sutcliffiella cohnii]
MSDKQNRRWKIINHLIELGVYKRDDGKQLYELSLEELEQELQRIIVLVGNHYGIKDEGISRL